MLNFYTKNYNYNNSSSNMGSAEKLCNVPYYLECFTSKLLSYICKMSHNKRKNCFYNLITSTINLKLFPTVIVK